MYYWLLRCITVRGPSAGSSQISPTKVEAHKYFLFTESSLVLKIKNNFEQLSST